MSLLLFPWTLAFYESVTGLGDGGRPAALRELRRQAARQAGAWPGQNLLLVLILIPLGVTLWLNAMVAMLFLPYLLKQLLGAGIPPSRRAASQCFELHVLGTSVALAAWRWTRWSRRSTLARFLAATPGGMARRIPLVDLRGRGAALAGLVVARSWPWPPPCRSAAGSGHPPAAAVAPTTSALPR